MSYAKPAACVIGILCLASFLVTPVQPASALSGALSLAPGETGYVSFGSVSANDIILWSWSSIDTIGSWIVKPDGSNMTETESTWGSIADMGGEWKIAFYCGNWIFTGSVSYALYVVHPEIAIVAPADMSATNTLDVTFSGTYDGVADVVELTSNEVHYVSTSKDSTNWVGAITLSEGSNTVFARASISWGNYLVTYSSPGVKIICDLTAPVIGSLRPLQDSHLRTDKVTVTWQGTDSISGIDHYEVRIDDSLWIDVDSSTSYQFADLNDGEHTIHVKAVDRAGNTVEAATSVNTTADIFSFDGPYYGLPIVGIVLAVVIAAILAVMTLRKRKGSPVPTTVPKEETLS